MRYYLARVHATLGRYIESALVNEQQKTVLGNLQQSLDRCSTLSEISSTLSHGKEALENVRSWYFFYVSPGRVGQYLDKEIQLLTYFSTVLPTVVLKLQEMDIEHPLIMLLRWLVEHNQALFIQTDGARSVLTKLMDARFTPSLLKQLLSLPHVPEDKIRRDQGSFAALDMSLIPEGEHVQGFLIQLVYSSQKVERAQYEYLNGLLQEVLISAFEISRWLTKDEHKSMPTR